MIIDTVVRDTTLITLPLSPRDQGNEQYHQQFSTHPQKGERKKIDLRVVMAYQFDPLIHRMVDKQGWGEEEATQCFEDTKRLLYLSTIAKGSVVPSKKIDNMWHDWILFTKDYAEFCQAVFGEFVHHTPRRRGDLPSTGGLSIGETIALAKATFGKLSDNWSYPSIVPTADCSCSSWCQCS